MGTSPDVLMISLNVLNTSKCTEHTLYRVCICAQGNTSVILSSSSNFGAIKSFHNGPIDTIHVLNGNLILDEDLYTAQKNFSHFLTPYAKCALRL